MMIVSGAALLFYFFGGNKLRNEEKMNPILHAKSCRQYMFFSLILGGRGRLVYDASRHDTESEIKRSTYASQ